MFLVIYSPFDAFVSAYRLFTDTYREEIGAFMCAFTWTIIFYHVYLYRKAELARNRLVASLEEEIKRTIATVPEIDALAEEVESLKASFTLELTEVKDGILNEIVHERYIGDKATDDMRSEIHLKIQEAIDDLKKSHLEVQKCGLATLRTTIESQKCELATLTSIIECQKTTLATVRTTMETDKSELQGDINRILAWLGTTPYINNHTNESLRLFSSRFGTVGASNLSSLNGLHSKILHQARVRQDISETAMRKTIETAFPVLPPKQKY